MEKIIISCLESRVETNRRMYARFLLGPFQDDNAITIATALRRSLLSKVKSIAITAMHIQGVTHEFSTIVGVRESVLDLTLNFQQVVLRKKTEGQPKRFYSSQGSSEQDQRLYVQERSSYKNGVESNLPFDDHPSSVQSKRRRGLENDSLALKEGGNETRLDQVSFGFDNLADLHTETVPIGYLQVQGPAVIYANDLQLPVGIECVDPTQYLATLSTEGLLVVKFVIGEKKASFDTNGRVRIGKKTRWGMASKERLVEDRAYDNPGGNTNGFKLPRLARQPLLHQNNLPHSPSYQLAEPFRAFDSTACLRNTIFLDPIFNSVFQANYIIEKDNLFNQPRERIALEFWTNGSIHPRQALHKASLSLISTFSIFRELFQLDSL